MREKSSFNIYFLKASVEITQSVIDNKDNLINNNDLIAPGPSLNDKFKLLKNPQMVEFSVKSLT